MYNMQNVCNNQCQFTLLLLHNNVIISSSYICSTMPSFIPAYDSHITHNVITCKICPFYHCPGHYLLPSRAPGAHFSSVQVSRTYYNHHHRLAIGFLMKILNLQTMMMMMILTVVAIIMGMT